MNQSKKQKAVKGHVKNTAITSEKKQSFTRASERVNVVKPRLCSFDHQPLDFAWLGSVKKAL